MQSQQRQVLLIVDYCASQKIDADQLKGIKLHFLHPNTTSHLQPLDVRIIQNFKVHYHKLLVRYFINCIDAGSPMTIDLKHAIHFTIAAWNTVSPETVLNCWMHSVAIPRQGEQAQAEPVQEGDAMSLELTELLHLISQLQIS